LSRTALLGLIAAGPAIVLAALSLGTTGVLASRGGGWPETSLTLPEAIATANYAEVARLLEDGTDPNPAATIREDLLTGHLMRLTPMQTAVWTRNVQIARMLRERGVIAGTTGMGVLKCLNAEHPDVDIKALLDEMAPDVNPDCATVTLPK
jgi:hypothetical protein